MYQVYIVHIWYCLLWLMLSRRLWALTGSTHMTTWVSMRCNSCSLQKCKSAQRGKILAMHAHALLKELPAETHLSLTLVTQVTPTGEGAYFWQRVYCSSPKTPTWWSATQNAFMIHCLIYHWLFNHLRLRDPFVYLSKSWNITNWAD